MIEWWERRQVPLYLGALVLGAVVGLLAPDAAPTLEFAVTPVLIAVLYATFLSVPFGRLAAAARDGRFLGGLLLLNFVLVPTVVFGLTRVLAHDAALLIGALLVLLTPCVDYVITFAGLAGGARERLLAATPVLMLGQLVLLPVFLLLFAGPGALEAVEVAPFLEAFALFIVVPLAAAGLTQWLARRKPPLRRVETGAAAAMVPLVTLVLALIVASQAVRIRDDAASLVGLVPVYVGFVVVMTGIGMLVARLLRQDTGAARATVFSGVTRNSLVVLPLALALPESLALAAAAVVTQTLVELVGMVVLVRLVPRLVRART